VDYTSILARRQSEAAVGVGPISATPCQGRVNWLPVPNKRRVSRGEAVDNRTTRPVKPRLAARARLDSEARRGAQSVHRALDILLTFEAEGPDLSVSELSDMVHLTMPTTHRLLKALQAKDMVIWNAQNRTYSLGPRIIRLAGVLMQREDLAALAEPWLEQLRDLSGETASLHLRFDRLRICVAERVSRESIRLVSGVGRTYPLHRGAAGKAILAGLPEAVVQEILEVEGLANSTHARLLAELKDVRERGFATSAGETVPGSSAIAAAIFGSGEQAVASINVTGPAYRFTDNRAIACVNLLLEACNAVAWQMGQASPGSQ
jgi:IclR family transcriptional regulator, KDG regulon repressor